MIRSDAATIAVVPAATKPPCRRGVPLCILNQAPDETRFSPTDAYRRFFTAGIVVILTAGASWGVWLLWQIGTRGTFTGASIHEINAHGHAQIFGWVALFIMGFGYQIFPRMWQTSVPLRPLVPAAFAMMIAGLLISVVAIALPQAKGAPAAALAGGTLHALAATIFAVQIGGSFARSGRPMKPHVAFILASITWFVGMSFVSVWHTWAVMTAPTQDALLSQIATYQAALRDMQIHGFALFMILGVSMRILPGMFGVGRIGERRGWIAWSLLLIAVAGEVILLIASQRTGSTMLAGMLLLPWLMLAAGVALIAWPWKLWRPLPRADRSGKFIRAAYAWLAVSLILLILLPAYMILRDMAFSHAYYGAIRHAFTVGFVSMMIVGISAKMVPGFRGIRVTDLPALWPAFVLINLGCFLRVSMQISTDWMSGAFGLIALSGVLEVAGLAWWGAHLLHVMWLGKPKAALARG